MQAADGTLHHALVRVGGDGFARLHAGHAHHAGIKRIDLAGDEHLNAVVDLDAGSQGVDARMGRGDVHGLAAERHGERDGRGICHARIGRNDMRFIHTVDVAHDDAVDVLHHAMLAHRPRAAGAALLARLEEQLHPAGQLIADGVKRLRRADEHRRVRIMAAGVHHACVFGAIRLIVVILRNRQRVHIRVDADGERRLLRIDRRDNRISAILVGSIGDAGGVQLAPHERRRPVKIPAKFRIHVQLASDANELLLVNRRNGVIHRLSLFSKQLQV